MHRISAVVPWQINNIFIILDLSFHKPLNLDISGFLALFFNFVFCPYLTQIYVNLRKFMGKWCSKWCIFKAGMSVDIPCNSSIRISHYILQVPDIHARIRHIGTECMAEHMGRDMGQWFVRVQLLVFLHSLFLI